MTADPLWVSEADVVAAIGLPEAIAAVRAALEAEHAGSALTLDKTAVTFAGSSTLHALGGIDQNSGLVGTKSWAHTPGGASPLLLLWDASTGALRAVVEAFALGQLRTAAVSAVATDALAPAEVEAMAIVGTGKQAMAQVAAVAAVRPLRAVRVFSPTPEHREHFGAALRRERADLEVAVVATVAEAADGAAVVTTVTRATEPMISRWILAPDVHVNALGAITPDRRELDPALVRAASLVVSDSPMAATTLSSEVDLADEVVSLSTVVGGAAPPRQGLTVFKAMGLGLADVAVGGLALERVVAAGAGRPIPPPTKQPPRLFGVAPVGTARR